MIEQLNEYETRLKKLHQLKEAEVISYANRYEKEQSIRELRIENGELRTESEENRNQNTEVGTQKSDSNDSLLTSSEISDADVLLKQGGTNKYSTAGRLILFRSMGRLSFATIRDATGDIQIAFVRGLCHFNTGRELVDEIEIAGQTISAYKFVEKFFDIGDFIGVRGELFMTKHGELTLFVNEFQMLSKALRPLGDKWHGVKDTEALYRQRYLDLTMNNETYQRFLLRSKFVKALREFYWKHDFIEIETPVLGNAASGAAAKPFITHHNDFDEDFFLRIAPETALKKATVGRFERVFEIGKQFRNEGSDPSHMQEFTSAEHYAVYRNFEDNMKFTEEMFDYIFDTLGLERTIKIKDKMGQEKIVDFTTPWQRIDYIAGVKQASGIDITQYTMEDREKLLQDIKNAGYEREGMDTQGVTTLIDYLYKKVLRPTILGPAFVYNYPKTMQPLARQSDDDENIVEQFQLVLNGWEVLKAYSELVDPEIQKTNFEAQGEALEKGDEEATSGDDEFVTAMEHGMPCQSGWGMGIDRIVSLLTGQDNLRDIVLFPLMKPINMKSDEGSDEIGGTDVKDKSLGDSETNSAGRDDKAGDYGTLPSKDQAQALVDKYLSDTKQHCEQVGQVMQWFAKKLGQDEHLRYLAGLLHDIDWDHIGKDASKHLGEDFEKIMNEIGIPDLLKEDIRSHYKEGTGIPVNSLIRKYLASVDELSGFIHACSLMRPTGLEGMKRKSLSKKIKTKTFAAGVSREHIKSCEKYLDIPLSEFSLEVVKAMQA